MTLWGRSPYREQADVYRERLAKYLQKAEDIKKSDLANYVAHRTSDSGPLGPCDTS